MQHVAAVQEIVQFNTVTDLMRKEASILQSVITNEGIIKKSEKTLRDKTIELALTMEERYQLEGNFTEIPKICARIKEIYQRYNIAHWQHVDRDLEDYPQFKRKYNSGSDYENELKSLGQSDEEKTDDDRISIRDRPEYDNRIAQAAEYALEGFNKFIILMRKYPPPPMYWDQIERGLKGMGEFWNVANSKKRSMDQISAMEMTKKMITDGVAEARKEDIIIANICSACSKSVKKERKFVEMKFHPVFEVRDKHNNSLIEILYKVWQCPECKGFNRMQIPLSREHVQNSWHVGISYAEELMDWIPGMVEALIALEKCYRDEEIGLRKFRTVPVFQNA